MRIKTNNKKGYEEVFPYDCIDLSYPSSKSRRGRVQHGSSQTIVSEGGNPYVVIPERIEMDVKRIGGLYDKPGERHEIGSIYSADGLSPTVDTCQGGNRQPMVLEGENEMKDYRIRKLTPKECLRLMGFDDEDADKLYKIESNTQIYKQAGNSIVVDVLEAIFEEMM